MILRNDLQALELPEKKQTNFNSGSKKSYNSSDSIKKRSKNFPSENLKKINKRKSLFIRKNENKRNSIFKPKTLVLKILLNFL